MREDFFDIDEFIINPEEATEIPNDEVFDTGSPQDIFTSGSPQDIFTTK